MPKASKLTARAGHAQEAQRSAAALATRGVKEMRTLWPALEGMDGVATRLRIMGVLPDIVNVNREAAAGLAADWYEATRPAAFGKIDPKMAMALPDKVLEKRLWDALEPLFRKGQEKNWVHAQEQTEAIVIDSIMDGFRDTIADTSADDPNVSHWVRVVEAGACSWCRKIAGEEYGAGGQFHRHPHCRCTNAPVFFTAPL